MSLPLERLTAALAEGASCPCAPPEPGQGLPVSLRRSLRPAGVLVPIQRHEETLHVWLIWRFPQDAPRVFPVQRLRFGCPCSEARVRQSLSIYAPREIARMTTEEGRITADCQFCGAHYNLDPKTVGQGAQNP